MLDHYHVQREPCWTKAFSNSFHDYAILFYVLPVNPSISSLYLLSSHFFLYLLSTGHQSSNLLLHLLSFLLAICPVHLHFCHLITSLMLRPALGSILIFFHLMEWYLSLHFPLIFVHFYVCCQAIS